MRVSELKKSFLASRCLWGNLNRLSLYRMENSDIEAELAHVAEAITQNARHRFRRVGSIGDIV